MNEDEAKRLHEDYRRTFLASKHGRRVLDDLLGFTGVYDECQTAKDEGRRTVGLQIVRYLNKNNFIGMSELEKAGVGGTNLDIEEFENG